MISEIARREYVERVISELGGPVRAARVLGVSHVAVHKWLGRGQVPIGRVRDVLAACEAAGVACEPEMLSELVIVREVAP